MVKIVKKETQKVYGLDKLQMEVVRVELTVTNPAYVSAQRFSKWNVTRIPKYLTFYDEHKDCIEVPLGYELPIHIDEYVDERICNTTDYPKINITLRDNQADAYKAWIKNTDNGIICMSTGKGKSILGIYCAYAMRQKALVIVHKDDLVRGWQNDCKVCFGDTITPGLVKASKRVVGEQITIATIQTLNSWAKKDLKSFEEFTKQFGMVIVDEMHHIAGSIYDLINHFPAYFRMGLTATPERADGLTDVMYWYLGKMAYKYVYTRDDKDILPVRVHFLPSGASYTPMCYKIPTRRNKDGIWAYKYVLEQDVKNPDSDWELVEVEQVPVKQRPKIPYSTIDDIALTSQSTLSVVGKQLLNSFNDGKSVILFFSQKIHCGRYFEHARDVLKIPEDKMCIYNGNYSSAELTTMREKIESGDIKVTFATYSIATEGTNVKAWDTAFLVSSISNGKNVEQAIGRARRAKAGKPKFTEVYDVRYPEVYTLKNHKWKRVTRYKDLKCLFVDDNKKHKSSTGRFSIGYR